MASYTHTGSIDAPPEEVWATIRDFGDGSWMGVDVDIEGEGVGAVRTVKIPNSALKEQCERLDDDERVLGYTITEAGGMPFEDYHATMQVRPEGSGTELVWSATYEPVGDQATAESVLEMIYSGGIEGLKNKLEG